MASTKPPSKKSDAGKALRKEQHKSRNRHLAHAMPAPLLPVMNRRQKKGLKIQGAASEKDPTSTAESFPAKQTDNKRPLEEDAQPPSKKTKNMNNAHTGDSYNCDYAKDLTTGTGAASLEHALDAGIDLNIIENLSSRFTVTDIHIISASKIKQKVSKILETLSAFSFAGPARPNIVVLYAKASAATKLITVSEIVTRNIVAGRGKFYQYNRLESTIVEKERKSGSKSTKLTIMGHEVHPDPDEMVDVDATEENTFETMQLPIERAVEGKPIKQAVPGMTIFLSRVRIESLRKLYNEQTNDQSPTYHS